SWYPFFPFPKEWWWLMPEDKLPFFSPSFGISIRGKRHTWGRFPYLTHRPSSCILSKYNLTFIESPTRHTQLCFLLVHLFL
ncbi:hypothetical protein VIGAN_10241100, partial [Vigna angularis var. angularis]